MSNDNKTLADAQPGGRVRLGDRALSTSEGARRYVANVFATQLRRHDFGDYILTELAADFACTLAQHLSAQPSPGGQDALATLSASWRACADKHDENAREADSIGDMTATVQYLETKSEVLRKVAAELEAALAARQPVGEPVADWSRRGVEPTDWRNELLTLAEHHGQIPAFARSAMRVIARSMPAPPAQAVELPYSLDADPVGIRARVADVITGTLMVAAQGHTPPPAGHWAEPFWQAARHDAARSLNVTLKLRELVAASKYMRDRVVETRGVKCMDDLDYAIDEAEKALTDSQAVGNG
ncbi:hypothetical protein [Stenotrophomonas maltophilia]|uniref:hypothetical protein n=1 Tax=Stenotrophomonas maltophilia TaxID=40324 RepID=UPI0039C226E5